MKIQELYFSHYIYILLPNNLLPRQTIINLLEGLIFTEMEEKIQTISKRDIPKHLNPRIN